MKKLVLLAALLASFVFAPQALAATPANVLDGDLTCGQVTSEGNVSTSLGQVWCGSKPASITSTLDTVLPIDRSTHKTFDGVPLDVNFALPSTGTAPFPVVGMYHGYGGSKFSFSQMQHWLDKGYAVYSVTQRGMSESCRSTGSQTADPTGCADGYTHLMDLRYEVRDSQNFLGELVDEGLISPTKIASSGGSYGGGMSMALATLKNRVMNLNGSLSPWQSPNGTPMSIAVSIPEIPWTELTYALAPNGNNLDYIKDAGYFGRAGVMKESYVTGLSLQARNAPIGTDPQADVEGWKALLATGEPYDSNPATAAMISEINTYHSSYGVDHSQAPAPLLISSGFTDDLFPVNEATRFYNRTRAQYPNTPLALFFGSFGHARGQSQANVTTARTALEDQWVDYYLTGAGSQPASNVTTYTQTCPNGSAAAGPYTASDWASIAPGEIRIEDSAPQTVSASGGDTAVAGLFNPVLSSNPCTTATGAKEPGSANYETAPAPTGGYTVMGAVTMVAKISLPGDNSQIAARLVDVAPDGTTKQLIERGLWRPTQSGFQVFQLFANGWKVEDGHVLRLELLPRDAATTTSGNPPGLSNYGRPSDGQQDATISHADIRIPVLENPGALGGLVQAPAKKVLPARPGVELANGYGSIGSETIADYANRIEPPCPTGTAGTTPPDCKPADAKAKVVGKKGKVKGKKLQITLTCEDSNASCAPATVKVQGKVKSAKKGKAKKTTLAKGSGIQLEPGETQTVSLKLTGKGKKAVKKTKKIKADVIINGEKSGKVTIKGKAKKKK
ncbi:MAG: acetylxylan esterase [Solirubrobacterales bacterium]|nr:acetylxylan esterase [Solirubrobacterales bacterium]